jgi:hypothetical protein
VFNTLRKRLFFWRRNKTLSREELRNIKQEADYLAATIDSTKGQLKPEDLERLTTFTDTIQDATERLNSE